MSNVIRMGVVGAGTIALRGILPHLSQEDVQERVTLQAVCDPFPGRAEAAAKKFGIPTFYQSLEELLEANEVDAVTIASPIGFHFEQGKKALEAGKHVHFNKTMTTTTAEATELIELAKSKGLVIIASPGEVLRPQVQKIKELIAEGAIGRICWAICGVALERYHEREEFRQGTDVLSNVDPSWYFRKPGGGPLYDMTVYSLHALTTILGPAKQVTSLSGTRIKEREFRGAMVPTDADDNTLILLDFGDNLFALAYGTAAGTASTGFSGNYYGTMGSVIGYKLNGIPISYPGDDVAAQSTGWDGDQWVLPHVVGPHRDIEEQHVFEDIMQLVDWVREGKPSPVTAEHARHVIEIIEAAYCAAATGERQVLKTTF
jgi:predicted dehydrogenase